MLKQSEFRTVMAICLGAIAGAVCRYYVGQVIGQLLGTVPPYGTFIINISGCFAMGLLTTLLLGPIILHPDLRLLILTGFLGSYTTFSSYELDSAHLLEQGHLQLELVYWVGSALAGFLSLQLGTNLAAWWLAKLEQERPR